MCLLFLGLKHWVDFELLWIAVSVVAVAVGVDVVCTAVVAVVGTGVFVAVEISFDAVVLVVGTVLVGSDRAVGTGSGRDFDLGRGGVVRSAMVPQDCLIFAKTFLLLFSISRRRIVTAAVLIDSKALEIVLSAVIRFRCGLEDVDDEG